MTGTRPPFQGDSLGDVFPGLKPMGYSVFALRAMRNVQTPGPFGASGRRTIQTVLNLAPLRHDSNLHLDDLEVRLNPEASPYASNIDLDCLAKHRL
jgi:hypothetical protein